MKDDRPVPKVIDFGVAKATQTRLTEKTLFTRLHLVDRHAGLHESGAGGAGQPGRGHAQRRLFAGSIALRVADRPPAVRHAEACWQRP